MNWNFRLFRPLAYDARPSSERRHPCYAALGSVAARARIGREAQKYKGSHGMLVELRAENYAVIDHAIASFGPGLNLLTG